MTVDPVDALYACRVDDDGRRWGEIATDRQREDAAAILSSDGPRRHFPIRLRGGSKTADTAAMMAVHLALEARPSDRLYCFAADRDQARPLHEAAGIVRRTPVLAGVQVGSYRLAATRGPNPASWSWCPIPAGALSGIGLAEGLGTVPAPPRLGGLSRHLR